MKKFMPYLAAIGLLLVVGCGSPGPEVAASLEDVVGTWQGIQGGGGFMQIEADGDWSVAVDLDDLEDGPRITSEVRFEGTQFFITDIANDFGVGEICANTGIYEVQLLADGNLKFVAIEDECEVRSNALQGAEGIDVEWKPVP